MNHVLHLGVIMIIVVSIHIPESSCRNDTQFSNCGASYKCGIKEITYPFYGASRRPDYCGYPGFQATCVNENTLTLNISSRTYRVLSIDNFFTRLTVARDDYWDSYCPKYLYKQYMYNTTLDFNLFSYVPGYQNLSLYYGCPAPNKTSGAAATNHFTCVNTSTPDTSVTRYLTPTPGIFTIGSKVVGCSDLVLVPVFSDWANTLTTRPTVSYLQAVINGGFELEWKANNSRCNVCAASGGQCGHDVGSGAFVCYCSDKPYGSKCGPLSSTGSSGSSSISVIPISVPVGVIIIGSMVLCYFLRKSIGRVFMKKSGHDHDLDEFIRDYGSFAPKQYNYSDVKKITNSFADKLGQGGYGCVYKGKLSDGRLVAVKILSETKGNGQEFLNEVASISRTSHVNVVSLLGFCYKGTQRALIYEFMSNISLDKFLFNGKSTNLELDRAALFKIAVGIARGLEYLHSGCNTRILHLDIKPHNILLDQDWCPKISDFGLAKLCQRKESVVSTMGARGTIGYIAPEVFNRGFGRVSYKSDVYSYGMMILEMAGVGKQAEPEGSTETSEMYFPDWIYKKLEGRTNVVPLRHNEVTGEEKDKEIDRKMILAGLWCIQTKPADRPSMTRVIEMLEGSSDVLQTPPKPFLFPPTSRSPQRTYSSSSLSSLSSTSQVIDIQS